LQARSKASPIAKVAASSNQTSWIGILFIGASRKARAGAPERLSVTEARSRFGDQTFWNGVIGIDTSRKARAGAQERLSVTEARSRFGDALTCSFDGELSDQNRPPCGLRANMATRRFGRSLKLAWQIGPLGS
jgi:hypothetical protein